MTEQIQVLMTQPLLQSCVDGLEERFRVHRLYEQKDRTAFLQAHGENIRALAGHAADAKLMDALPNLEIIANFGVGYDNIDTDAAKARNIRVTNTPDVLNDAMGEITIGLMISLARKIPQAERYLRAGKWAKEGVFGLQSELNGKTVGIVGLGSVGKEIATRCQAMKMRVVYHGRNRQRNVPYVYYDNLKEMARDVDWLVVIVPGGEGTKNLVDRDVLMALGPNGMLVNVARGSVVDEPVLIEMLQQNRIGGAALDVFADEPNVPEALIELDNVVLSPHQGSATHQTRYEMGALVVANLEAHFAGNPLLTPVV